MGQRRALVTGIAGQDGSYLAQLLLTKGYSVFGIVRSGSPVNPRLAGSLSPFDPVAAERLHVVAGDIRDREWLANFIEVVRPDEIYNLAAQSNVAQSFEQPEYTHDVNYVAVDHMLAAVRSLPFAPRFFQASSSEMFGLTAPPQNETSPLLPQSPYALAKTGAHVLVRETREQHGVYAVSGISFNHESPRRPTSFVTRKISSRVAEIVRGEAEFIELGNLDVVRDWGYAPEHVEGMWRSLQHDEPGDYVFASGEGHTVREFVEFSFSAAGLDWRNHLRQDVAFERPHDVKATIGDPAKALSVLGWQASTTARELARIMVEADISRVGDESHLDVPQLASWQ